MKKSSSKKKKIHINLSKNYDNSNLNITPSMTSKMKLPLISISSNQNKSTNSTTTGITLKKSIDSSNKSRDLKLNCNSEINGCLKEEEKSQEINNESILPEGLKTYFSSKIKIKIKDNSDFKGKISAFRKLLKEKLKTDRNPIILPKIKTSFEFKKMSNEITPNDKEQSDDITCSLQEMTEHANFNKRNKIIPNNIKIRNFKSSVKKKCLVLSGEKFIF